MPIIDEITVGPTEVPAKSPLELHAEALWQAMQERRFGRFDLTGPPLYGERFSLIAAALHREAMILRCEYDFAMCAFRYTACSQFFASVPDGMETPLYRVLCHQEEGRTVRLELDGPANAMIHLDQ